MKRRTNFWLTLAFAGLTVARNVYAEAPETSDPDGRLIENFDQPGEFPTTVTAANVNIQPQAGAEFDAAGEDVLKVTFPAAGPIKWTESRHNSGDLGLLIGPAQPANTFSYPPNAFVENFQAMNDNGGAPIDPNSHELTTLAWRVSNATGALFATSRHNGVNDGYLTSGSPVGTIYGVAYFAVTFGQGWGFRMLDGVYANGGNGSSDLVTGAAGAAGGGQEASSNVAAVYLPYEQGWQGAWVTGAAEGEGTFASSSPDLSPSTVMWTSGSANVTLPGVNSATDGMLFVAPANGSSQTRIAAAFPNNSGGWTTNVRFDEDADVTGQTILDSGNDFQFVYIPYDAVNLIGGHVEGSNGSLINSAGSALFDVVRNSAGQYSISVFEANGVTKRDENDGMLMLSVASSMPGAPTLADRTFLSYQFDPGSGNFIVQSRELLSIASATPDDAFGNDFQLRDSDFYFAWVDFANPLSLPSFLGDFDNDKQVDGDDLTLWRTSFGSAGADADGDGDSDGNDFLIWQRNVGAGAPTAAAAGAVPEPSAALLMLAGMAAIAMRKRIG